MSSLGRLLVIVVHAAIVLSCLAIALHALFGRRRRQTAETAVGRGAWRKLAVSGRPRSFHGRLVESPSHRHYALPFVPPHRGGLSVARRRVSMMVDVAPGDTEKPPPRRTSAFTPDHMNKRVQGAAYEVRGAVVNAAMALEKQLAEDPSSLPFDRVVYCNIGNPQSLGQKPLTYARQTMAVCNFPELADAGLLPADVRERAKRVLKDTADGSIGAYSHSQGLPAVRQDVADFIGERDGYPASADDVFLLDGASPGIKAVLEILCDSPSVGVMVPIPQYPLYSATISLCGAQLLPYYLREESQWSLNVAELERSLELAQERGTDVRALCVINPGNPTGAALTEENIRSLIRLAKQHRLVLMADEVYQNNVWREEASFVSFRKVLLGMGEEADGVELISFHSCSKGIMGECGYRGGYMELLNVPPEGREQLYKLASISLCPNVNGQIMTSLLCRPPVEGEESYALYKAESDELHASLNRRAALVTRALNEIEGVSCQPVQGALYAFPRISLSPGAQAAAAAAGMAPDVFFSLSLLKATGVCVVPGSGFGQEKGTFHFRTTILPPEDRLAGVLKSISDFVGEFRAKYDA